MLLLPEAVLTTFEAAVFGAAEPGKSIGAISAREKLVLSLRAISAKVKRQ